MDSSWFVELHTALLSEIWFSSRKAKWPVEILLRENVLKFIVKLQHFLHYIVSVWCSSYVTEVVT